MHQREQLCVSSLAGCFVLRSSMRLRLIAAVAHTALDELMATSAWWAMRNERQVIAIIHLLHSLAAASTERECCCWRCSLQLVSEASRRRILMQRIAHREGSSSATQQGDAVDALDALLASLFASAADRSLHSVVLSSAVHSSVLNVSRALCCAVRVLLVYAPLCTPLLSSPLQCASTVMHMHSSSSCNSREESVRSTPLAHSPIIRLSSASVTMLLSPSPLAASAPPTHRAEVKATYRRHMIHAQRGELQATVYSVSSKPPAPLRCLCLCFAASLVCCVIPL